MRSAVYWAAWNAAAYLAVWLLHCFFWNTGKGPLGGIVWTGDGPAVWPVQFIPGGALLILTVNLLVFAALRPLGEDCGGGK